MMLFLLRYMLHGLVIFPLVTAIFGAMVNLTTMPSTYEAIMTGSALGMPTGLVLGIALGWLPARRDAMVFWLFAGIPPLVILPFVYKAWMLAFIPLLAAVLIGVLGYLIYRLPCSQEPKSPFHAPPVPAHFNSKQVVTSVHETRRN